MNGPIMSCGKIIFVSRYHFNFAMISRIRKSHALKYTEKMCVLKYAERFVGLVRGLLHLFQLLGGVVLT